MSRPQSDKTALRHAMRDINSLRRSLTIQCAEVEKFRARSTKAEQEAADWRKRFDALLSRVPHMPAPFLPIPGAPDTCMFCGQKHDGMACPKMAPTSSHREGTKP